MKNDELAIEYARTHRGDCAVDTWGSGHMLQIFVILELLLYAALHGFSALFMFVALFSSIIVFTIVCFRLTVIAIAILADPEIRISAEEVEAARTHLLPVYTILVPLFREENVARGIIHALDQLDYPRDKLDIKLLLESDDRSTIDAVSSLSLGREFEIVFVEASLPRTKPKACNHGLARALGEYLVIFDAEDQPEKDQLLKAVLAFSSVPENTACLQAKLNYFNPRENFITRCFALEYTAWFDLILPGLQWLGGPIPLGGTSNHFRTQVLRDLGGWDPYNVTEDCDLGIRLAIKGYCTQIINSTTFEEANTHLNNWIRQRSRWVKGYLQTYLVHTRRPMQLVGRLGPWKSILFLFSVAGVALQQLLNLACFPVLVVYLGLIGVDYFQGRNLWLVVAGSRDEYRVAWKLLYWGAGEEPLWAVASAIGFWGSIILLSANLLFVCINLIACQRRGYYDLWKCALASPAYWILGSIAAWRGAIQLLYRPHFWEKTVHGLSLHSVNNLQATDK